MKNSYNLRHLPCTMDDFFADRHRFVFEYENKKYNAECIGFMIVNFDKNAINDISPNILKQIVSCIWDKVDHETWKWRYPEEAYKIANNYCEENFR